MEYLKVQFDPAQPRDVLANGNVIGQSDTELIVPADFYQITLSGDGYAPPFWNGQIAGTLVTNPLVIRFSRA
jgi:hypothetical protein